MNETLFLHELRRVFKENNVDLNETNIMYYGKAFMIISSLLHDKLSVSEIFEAYDYLSDLVLENKPQFAAFVPKNERIRVQMRAMEELPQTAGRLTREEKEVFAFCVYYSTCVQIFDEKTQTVMSALVDFKSTDHILKQYRAEKEDRPDFFRTGTYENRPITSEYGFSVDQPIRLSSIRASYAYLDSLYYGDAKVHYSRIGSCTNAYGETVDQYKVSVEEGRFLRTKNKEWVFYINPYAYESLDKAPNGFAKECGQYTILTKNTYKNTVLKEAQIVSMEEFIDNVKILINILGYKVLVPVPKANDETIYLYCKGSGASAKGFVSAGGFTVLEGSTVSNHTVPSLETKGKSYYNLRNALIKDGTISDRVFTRDYEFKAPSAASAVILGHTSSGNVDWKTADGTKLKDL
jgi:hypothetical protein